MALVRPYRVIVFTQSQHTTGKGKRQRTRTIGSAYVSWSPFQRCGQEARLPDAGSFLYPGFLRAQEAAKLALRLPGTHQVSVRTDQDTPVYRYFKHADGTVTGYADGRDE
jgi:hypothetical protein